MGKLTGNGRQSLALTKILEAGNLEVGNLEVGNRGILGTLVEGASGKRETLEEAMEDVRYNMEQRNEDASIKAANYVGRIVGQTMYSELAGEMVENAFVAMGVEPEAFNETLAKYGLDNPLLSKESRESALQAMGEKNPEMLSMYNQIDAINKYCKERNERISNLPTLTDSAFNPYVHARMVAEIDAEMAQENPVLSEMFEKARKDNAFETNHEWQDRFPSKSFDGTTPIVFNTGLKPELELDPMQVHVLEGLNYFGKAELTGDLMYGRVHDSTISVRGFLNAVHNEYRSIAIEMTESVLEEAGVQPGEYMAALDKYGLLDDYSMEENAIEMLKENQERFERECPEMAEIYHEIKKNEDYTVAVTFHGKEVADAEFPGMSDRFEKAAKEAQMENLQNTMEAGSLVPTMSLTTAAVSMPDIDLKNMVDQDRPLEPTIVEEENIEEDIEVDKNDGMDYC